LSSVFQSCTDEVSAQVSDVSKEHSAVFFEGPEG
jgi:hypothetical protein